MTTIKLKTGTWIDNAGIVGIEHILKHADIDCEIEGNVLPIDLDKLDHFGDHFFDYLTEKYRAFLSYTFIIDKGKSFFKRDDWDEGLLKELNAYLERAKYLLTSNSYLAAYQIAADSSFDIIAAAKALSKINLRKRQSVDEVKPNIERTLQQIEQIIAYLAKPNVKKYVMAKNVMYTVITRFWNGVSFLHRNATKKDPIAEYNDYFIEPLKKYYEADHRHDKYCCFHCGNPIKKLSKPAAYDLAWLNKMGVDMNRKSSHFWNLDAATCYICPVCNFIFSCIPAGFTNLKGQGYFVNSNSYLTFLLGLNKDEEKLAIQEDATIDLYELRTYYKIIEIMEQSKVKRSTKELANIQIVKLNDNNDLRPYTFNILSKDKLHVIDKNKKNLGKLIHIVVNDENGNFLNVYDQVLHRLYENRNQFDLIQLIFRASMPDRAELSLRNVNVLHRLLLLNNDFIYTLHKRNEAVSMSGYSSYVSQKTIDQVMQAGQQLAHAYLRNGAANKLQGITYRLLNALKSKNTSRFMDSFLNAYLYVKNSTNGTDLIIPTDFSSVLNNEERLQTLGYAFILGLRSWKAPKKEEEPIHE